MIVRRGYYRYPMHRPLFGFLFAGLALLFIIKAAPLILPILLVFVVWKFVSRQAGCGIDVSLGEKPKRKNDYWDDDEPMIV